MLSLPVIFPEVDDATRPTAFITLRVNVGFNALLGVSWSAVHTLLPVDRQCKKSISVMRFFFADVVLKCSKTSPMERLARRFDATEGDTVGMILNRLRSLYVWAGGRTKLAPFVPGMGLRRPPSESGKGCLKR